MAVTASTCGFDLESRSRTNIKSAGSYKYIEDPSTKLLCFAYAFDDQAPKPWVPGDPEPTDLLDHIENGGEISGWNVGGFDSPFWNAIIAPQYDWPRIQVTQLNDTMARAAMMNLPQKLGDCARVLNMPEDQQKNKRGEYLINRLCKPKIRRKGGLPIEEYFVEDPELFRELAYEYCPQDVVTERALASRLVQLPERERRFWIVTQRINERGVPVDAEEIRNIQRTLEPEKRRLSQEASRIAKGAFDKLSQGDKVRSWVRSRGIDCDSLDAEHVEEFLKRKSGKDALPADVYRVIELYSAVNQTSITKYDKMLEMQCRDGTVKGGLTYHGASTGRDASRGLNVQNVAKPPRSVKKKIDIAHELLGEGDWEAANLYFGEDLIDAGVACIRGVIKAPKGYRFIDVDYSSIENRVGSWIAGHTAKLDMFRAGLDEYKTFASNTMFGVPYEDVTDEMRQFCKPIILGGIFGQGWKGMIDYAKKYGVVLEESRSQQAIEAFREEYKPVQRMWYRCGDAAIEAVQFPGKVTRAGAYLRFKYDGRFLMMQLPSGRKLRWYQPRVEKQMAPWGEMKDVVTAMGINTFTRKWQRSKIIGSSFFQSSVQATAADIMRYGCLSLEDAGYHICMRIHDEFLSLVRDGYGSVEEMVEIIRKTEPWAEGLPIDGSGWEGPRFKKD